jgi:hypothetical protein
MVDEGLICQWQSVRRPINCHLISLSMCFQLTACKVARWNVEHQMRKCTELFNCVLSLKCPRIEKL